MQITFYYDILLIYNVTLYSIIRRLWILHLKITDFLKNHWYLRYFNQILASLSTPIHKCQMFFSNNYFTFHPYKNKYLSIIHKLLLAILYWTFASIFHKSKSIHCRISKRYRKWIFNVILFCALWHFSTINVHILN